MKEEEEKLDSLTHKIVSEEGIELDKLVMGVQDRDDVIVEHLNGDALDCRKENLRVVYLKNN